MDAEIDEAWYDGEKPPAVHDLDADFDNALASPAMQEEVSTQLQAKEDAEAAAFAEEEFELWDKEARGLGIDDADRERLRGWEKRPSAQLYQKYKSVFDNPKYFDQKSGKIYWPANDGFLNGSQKIVLKAGTRIDRYGSDTGRYVSPVGVPIEARSLAPAVREQPLTVYVVKEDIVVQAGLAAPWFDAPGGGTQYYLPMRVKDLIKTGKLERMD